MKALEAKEHENNGLRVQLNVSRDEVARLRRELTSAQQSGIPYSRVKRVYAPKPEKRHLYVMALQKELKKYVQELGDEVYIEVLLPEKNAQG